MQLHYRIQWLLLQPIARSYFHLKTFGVDKIPPVGPVLLAVNHVSHLDPLLIAIGLKRQVHFLAKEELFSIPVLNWWLRWNGVNPVARRNADLKSLRRCLKWLDEGRALVVFPEGTRSEDGKLQPLEDGAAWLSVKSCVPLLPLFIHGTFEAMPRKRWFPRPKPVTLRVGPEIRPEDFYEPDGGRGQIERFTKHLSEVMLSLQNEAEAERIAKE